MLTIFCLDGAGGRKAFDGIDVGLVYLVHELACVGRERLDVSALALPVKGVEGEAAFPRTADARDDDELIARNF